MRNFCNSTRPIIILPTAIFIFMEIWIWQKKLAFIDEHYLSAFERLDVDSEISRDRSLLTKRKDLVMEYPVSESESEEGNSYLAYSTVVGDASDVLTGTAFEVLDYALLSAPGAPH